MSENLKDGEIAIPGDAVPVLHPHFVRSGEDVFFCTNELHRSRRPTVTLTAESVRLYDSIDGNTSMDKLATICDCASAHVRLWYDLRMIELILPRTAAVASTADTVLIIEPHMDDVALSVGGRILAEQERARYIVLTFIDESDACTAKSFRYPKAVTAMRRKEQELFARVSGCRIINLGLLDAPLRHKAVKPTYPGPKTITDLAGRIAALLLDIRPSEVWIPAAPAHPDHVLSRHAALEALRMANASALSPLIILYEDLPYVADAADPMFEWTEGALAGNITSHTVNVSHVWESKMHLLSIYGSQFKSKVMEGRIRPYAESLAKGSGQSERYFVLTALPPQSPLARLTSSQRAWCEAARKAGRVTLVGSPRWGKGDVAMLAEALHLAKIKVLTPGSFTQTRGPQPLAEVGDEEFLQKLLAHESDKSHPVCVVFREGRRPNLNLQAIFLGRPYIELSDFAGFAWAAMYGQDHGPAV